MNDPLHTLRFLAWKSLLLFSALTTFIVIVLELLLGLGYTPIAIIRSALSMLYASSWGLIEFAVAVGVGALAVYLLKRFAQHVIINTANLWALILCLALLLFLKSLFLQSLLHITFVLVDSKKIQSMGIVVGVFCCRGDELA